MTTKKKIMLIEDDGTMRSLLKTLLELEGHQAFICENCDMDLILPVLHEENPDVILLDVNLRDINGFDILQKIREDEKFATIRVLMSSGMPYKEKCLRAGANGFLQKPYMPDDLINMINNNN